MVGRNVRSRPRRTRRRRVRRGGADKIPAGTGNTYKEIDAKGVDVENNVDIESTSNENSDGSSRNAS